MGRRIWALVDKINESDLKNHLRDLLQVPADASLRQLKRARFKQIGRYQEDYLSESNETSAAAKEKLNKIHQAFECLSSEKKFEEYLFHCNRLISEGQATKDEILSTSAYFEDEEDRPVLTLVDDMPVITPIVEDSNIIAGPSPGTPIPVKEVNGDTGGNGTPFVNKEEEERILNLKRKQLEKQQQQEKSRSNRLESLKKKTLKAITEAATKEARREANALKAKGKPDPDEFFECVMEATKTKVNQIKDEQIAKMKRMDLPVTEETTALFEQECKKSADSATQAEFFLLKEDGPLKPRSNSPVYLIVTVLAGAAVFLFFINFATMMWDNLPDPTANQFKEKPTGVRSSDSPTPVDPKLKISTNLALAKGKGLAPMAGVAGMAGFATTLDIPGSSDYNAALHLAYKQNFDKSIKQFQSSLSKNKNLFQTQYNLASLYYWKNDASSATTTFAKSALLRPDLAQANYNRGVIYLKKALDLTGAIDEKKATKVHISKTLNRATKLVQASVVEFNTTIKKAPSMPQAFYNRAIARYTLEDFTGAKEDFVEALRLNTRMEAAKFNIVVTANKLSNEQIENEENIPVGPEGPQGPPGPGYL